MNLTEKNLIKALKFRLITWEQYLELFRKNVK
jgi:hypothetical protein